MNKIVKAQIAQVDDLKKENCSLQQSIKQVQELMTKRSNLSDGLFRINIKHGTVFIVTMFLRTRMN